MQNNEAVEQLYVEYHDVLVGIAHNVCGKICSASEDMVQDLYLELLQSDEDVADNIDEDGCFKKGYVNFILREKLAKIIINNCLVDTE